MGIVVLPMKFPCQWDYPVLNVRSSSQELFKVNYELTFFYSSIYGNSILFWLKFVNPLWTLFLTSKCIYIYIYIVSIILKVWTIFLLHNYHNFLKSNDSKSIATNHEKHSILLQHLEIISNNFSFRYNTDWDLTSLVCRWSNEITIRYREFKHKRYV